MYRVFTLPNSPALCSAPNLSLKPKTVPFESHSLTALQLANIAFSLQTRDELPNTLAPAVVLEFDLDSL